MSTTMVNPLDAFKTAMLGAGLEPPDALQDDGEIHRFSTSGKRKDDAGWYVVHTDGVPAGAFGCWRTGITHTWCAKTAEEMTEAERSAHQRRVQAMRAQRDADTAERQQLAAAEAARRWAAATPATAHPYLVAKGVQAHGVRVEADGFLIVPMRDTEGKLWNIERINPANFRDKKGLYRGRRSGLYSPLGKPDGVLVVCEGFGTGASIHEATGHAVAVAFNAGNLEAVAKALASKYPALRLIVAGDDDWQKPGNPGATHARAAALAVGALVAMPQFPADRGAGATDMNDLHQCAGLEAVRACIEAAVPVLADGADGGDFTEAGEWPDPVPLPNELTPVRPFDPELLPGALRGWVADIAHRMQCPVDFTAVGAVVALSSLIGARAVVAPKARDDWRVVPNLWGLIVGRPGVMKSPALTEALKPLHRLEATEREQWKMAHDAWELDCKVMELQGADREKKARGIVGRDPAAARALLELDTAPAEPMARRYVVNDATVEKLGELLTTNPWGLLVFRDELNGLLRGMDRQGQEGARGFYLTGYDGNQGYAVDRIMRGETYIPRVCLAMLGGTQPGKVQSYVRDAVSGGNGDDGLLQRFGLAVWPDVDKVFTYTDQWPNTQDKQAAWAVFERLASLQPATDTEPQEWRFSEEAQAIFREWMVPFETELRSDELHPALVSHLAKYRKLVPALALIFALVDTPDNNGVIHENELLRALAWSEYLRSHAERLYAAAVIPETAGAVALLNKIKAGAMVDGDGVMLDQFTPRLVAVKGWAGLGSPDDVRSAAELLADHGFLARETVKTSVKGGRPSERYRIHPALFRRAG